MKQTRCWSFPRIGTFCLLFFQGLEARAAGDEIVLFDAGVTPLASVVPQSQGDFAVRDGLLQVETKGGTGYPGVRIKGAWDLSGCNRVTFELANRDKKGELPLTIRLENADADPGKLRGVFVDRVKVTGKAPKAYAVALPPWLPNVREIKFKSVAPDRLYFGCRFAGSTEAAVRMAAKYCDAISYNIYRHALDTFKLPDGVDMPVLIGEFHFGALDRGLFHESLIGVPDQAARGKAYTAYVTSALRHPSFIGVHWHQFGDQPTTGRFDGENFQNGFVDVCDTPYPETIAGIREVGYRLYEIRSGR